MRSPFPFGFPFSGLRDRDSDSSGCPTIRGVALLSFATSDLSLLPLDALHRQTDDVDRSTHLIGHSLTLMLNYRFKQYRHSRPVRPAGTQQVAQDFGLSCDEHPIVGKHLPFPDFRQSVQLLKLLL